MNILVTGGAGFIGSHFVDYLLSHNDVKSEISAVTVIDKLTYAGNLENLQFAKSKSKFKFLHADICDFNFNNYKFDWIVNFAAETHVDRSLLTPLSFVESNVNGTLRLLEYCRRNSDTKFLQVSTDEVYGSIDLGSWTEENSLAPRSPYSASKASADLLTLAYHTSFGLDVRITRCSNNYGFRQNQEKMIPTIISNLSKNIPIPVYGDGKNIRDWLHVSDHIQGIWKTMLNGTKGNVYNIGGGVEMSNLDLIALISKIMGIDTPNLEFVPDRKGHDFRYSLDFSKAETELGYVPKSVLTLELERLIKGQAVTSKNA